MGASQKRRQRGLGLGGLDEGVQRHVYLQHVRCGECSGEGERGGCCEGKTSAQGVCGDTGWREGSAREVVVLSGWV